MSTASIRGEAGDELAFTIALGTRLDGTTVTSQAIRARSPTGVLSTLTATRESVSATSITVVATLAAQLAKGGWRFRPVLYTGSSVLVTAAKMASVEVDVRPDLVPNT